MTALQHPNIVPPLVIGVPAVDAAEYVRAGWIPAEQEAPASEEKRK